MEKLKTDQKTLRKFGSTMGIALGVIFFIIFLKAGRINLWILSLSTLFFALGAILPAALKPVYIVWMNLAAFLGWVNSRLVLLIIFYLLMTPIALVMKLCRVDPLERKFDKNMTSYWKKKEQKGASLTDYERQF